MTQIDTIQGFDEIYRHAVRNNQEERIEGIDRGRQTERSENGNRERRVEKVIEKRLNHTKYSKANDSKQGNRRERRETVGTLCDEKMYSAE